MKTLLKKNKKVSILPQEVQGAAEGTIKRALKDFFEVEIPQEDLKYYKTGENVELFAAVDAGINLIDTAQPYGCGHSEEVVGRAVKQQKTTNCSSAVNIQEFRWTGK